MRFRKQIKLFPGVKINLSKSGLSTTIGGKGASLNINKSGTYLNTGIPGTGFYDRKKISGNSGRNNQQDIPILTVEPEVEIASSSMKEITSGGLTDFKKLIDDCIQQRKELSKELYQAKFKSVFLLIGVSVSYILIFGFFWKKPMNEWKSIKEDISQIRADISNSIINVESGIDGTLEKMYTQFSESYNILKSAEYIWDMLSSAKVDQKATKSAASQVVKRQRVYFGKRPIEFITSQFPTLHFKNANGADFYMTPLFILVLEKTNTALIDYKDLVFEYEPQKFMETETIPKDSKVVEHTWTKVNKNGTPDKRFKDNKQIPVCLYGQLLFKSKTGLNEAYVISDNEKAKEFSSGFVKYLKALNG